DPGYHYHLAMSDLWSRVTLRIAEAELLPLRYSRTGQFALDELQALDERLDDANADRADTSKLVVNWAPLRQSAQALRDRAAAFESAADAALAGGGAWPGGTGLPAKRQLIPPARALLGEGRQ